MPIDKSNAIYWEIRMSEEIIFYKRRIFWWVCGLPSLLSCFYLFVLATPRYVSEAVVRVYTSSPETDASGGGMIGEIGGGSSISSGAYIFKKYIQSWDMFQILGVKKLYNHWSKGDFISHFGGILTLFSANDMKLWAYYKNHVLVKLDEVSGLLIIKVHGYSADFVCNLNHEIIEQAQNKLLQSYIKADQAERDMLSQKLLEDRNKLRSDLDNISLLQKSAGISDLKSEYQAVLESLSEAQKERIIVKTKASATQFLAERGEKIAALKVQLASLDEDIAAQRKEIASQADVYKKYEEAESNVQEDIRNIMLDEQSLLESFRSSLKHAYYIDVIEEPIHPTNPTRPRALYWAAILFFTSFVIYLLVK